MRRLVGVVVLLAVFSSGCEKKACLVTAGIGAGVTGLMIVGARQPQDGALGFALIGIVSGFITAGALVNYVIDVDDENRLESEKRYKELDEEARAETERKAEREHAIALMKTAQVAAAAGDCPQTRTLDDQVCALDPELHDNVFARDAAIAACITPRDCTGLASELARQRRALAKQLRDLAATQADAKSQECFERRARLVESMSRTSDVDERRRILSSLPDCSQSNQP